MRRNWLAAFALALLLSGCAGSAAIGPGLSAKQQLLEQVLEAPGAICTAVQMQAAQDLLSLKALLTAPSVSVSLPPATMAPPPAGPTVPTPPTGGPVVTPSSLPADEQIAVRPRPRRVKAVPTFFEQHPPAFRLATSPYGLVAEPIK